MMQMEKVKLCELADIYLGVTHTPEYVFDGVPFLSVKDISSGKICFDDCKYISKEEYESLSEGAKPKVGDMLFCRVGTLGKPIIIPEGTPLFGSFVSLGYLRNKNADRCDLNYLRYWMYSNSFWKQVNSNVKGASQVNLNTGWLSKFDIDLPDMPEQKYRISVLDKCKVIIEQREEELKVLDDLIKARFVEMFGTPYGNEKGFPMLTVDDVIEFTGGAQPDKKYFEYEPTEDNIRLIQIRDYKTDNYITYIPKSMAKRFCDADDIMIGRYGPPIFQILKGIEGSYNVALMKATPKMGNKEFIRYFLKQECLFNYLDGLSQRTAGQSGIEMPALKAYPFPYPPIELQEEFEQFVNQVDKSKVAVQKSLDETQQLFDSLMQKYFG